MEKILSSQHFPTIKRVRQRSDSHCGPAVIVMLASYAGASVKQHDVVLAAQAKETYRTRGMTVFELAKGLTVLHPELSFWYKPESTIDDLDILINKFGYPVGVEWQGAFGQYADEDNGHYSMITAVNKQTNTIVLSDPFYYFAGVDRTFPIDEFIERWWDINEVNDKESQTPKIEKDTHMIFLVTPSDYEFPSELGIKRYA
jgi:hypothetical protein